MSKHPMSALAGALAVVLTVVALVPLTGQAPAPRAKPAPKAWTPPRTPWGDPDISGNLTNLYEVGTPFERPDEFAGRRLEDIKGQELAGIRRGIQERSIAAANTPGQIRGTPWVWWDSFQHDKGGAAWFVMDPPDGKIPPLTAEGQQRAVARAAARRNSGHGPADSWEDRSLYDRCISRGLPGSMMPVIYGNSYQIVQAPGQVVIRYEMIHEARVIPLDGRPHISKDIRLYMGDARGHWENNTLVVETTNFKEETAYRGANPESLRLVERFTRAAPDKIMWTVTVEDPKTWTRAWTFGMPLTINDSEAILEYACHEGNYAMTAILGGARAEDKAGDEAVKAGRPRPRSTIPIGGEGER